MKKYTIKGNGTEDYGKHIINFFEKLGAVNSFAFDCYDKLYFYKDNYKRIQVCSSPPPTHTEIELLPNGMAKGVWYKWLDGNYFKPFRIEKEKTYGYGIYKKNSGLYKYDELYWWVIKDLENFTPLTDLTEIQEFLPDGHEDKYKLEPTDLIEPSTEYILKLIYDKFGYIFLKKSIANSIPEIEYKKLKGENRQKKAENLINKWQPKPKIWKEDGIIMISTDAPEGAVEYTQERLNGLLNINI